MLTLESAGLSDVGGRKNNEDAFAVHTALGLYVVADGMGGYEGGEVASALTVEGLSAFVERNQRDPRGTWPCKEDRRWSFQENLLAAAVTRAHLDIVAKRIGPLRMMGSTVVALLRDGERVCLAHVGDSRIYRLRAGRVEQLTRDHSLWQEMNPDGEVPRGDFPFRNVITRALGTDTARPDVRSIELEAGDAFLLCTDGLYDPLDTPGLAQMLALPPEEAAKRLIDTALEKKTSDNATGVVIRAR